MRLFAGNHTNQRARAAFDVTGPLDDNERVAARLSGMTRYADSQPPPERGTLCADAEPDLGELPIGRLDLMAYLRTVIRRR